MDNHITANIDEMTRLAGDLRAAGVTGARAFQASLMATGVKIRQRAAANAAFSSRIPQSLQLIATPKGVRVTAGGPIAPDAAPIENRGRGYVSHPVFGRPGSTTSLNSHPAFLTPAFNAVMPTAAQAGGDATMDAIVRTLRG